MIKILNTLTWPREVVYCVQANRIDRLRSTTTAKNSLTNPTKLSTVKNEELVVWDIHPYGHRDVRTVVHYKGLQQTEVSCASSTQPIAAVPVYYYTISHRL